MRFSSISETNHRTMPELPKKSEISVVIVREPYSQLSQNTPLRNGAFYSGGEWFYVYDYSSTLVDCKIKLTTLAPTSGRTKVGQFYFTTLDQFSL